MAAPNTIGGLSSLIRTHRSTGLGIEERPLIVLVLLCVVKLCNISEPPRVHL